MEPYLDLARLTDEEFVRRAYRLILRRDPEPAAAERLGRVSRARLLLELAESDEFAGILALEEAITRAQAEPRWLEGPPGSDERAIEVPWVLARARGARRVLDLGSAHAEPAYLAGLLELGADELVGVDLVAAEIPGLDSRVADIRALPFAEGAFDCVLCVSTLEHVGRDNRVYGAVEEHDETGMQAALAELRRVLHPAGRLLASVPCGEVEDHGWFVQLDVRGWMELFAAGGFAVAEEEVYELTSAGWRSAASFDPSGVRYGTRGPAASAVLCVELRPAGADARSSGGAAGG